MNILPEDIFDTLDKYWGKTVIYTFPKQDDYEYLEDSYQRSKHFNDFIKVDNVPDFREGKFEFTFDIDDELLLEWEDEDDYFRHPELGYEISIKVNGMSWDIEDSELVNIKKNLLDKLRISYMFYFHALNKVNYINDNENYTNNNFINDNYTKRLHVCEDDAKCINHCGFYTEDGDFERDLDNMETLYCRVCFSKFRENSKEFHAKKYKEHLINLVAKYKAEYDTIIEFLRNPIPKSYYITDYNNKKITFTLSDL